MIRSIAIVLFAVCAACGAHAACEAARGADGKFAGEAALAAAALASESCDKPLDRRHASARFWRPEPGLYMREEIWAFGPEGGRGTCFIDAEANAAGEPDQIVLRCVAAYRCPDGGAGTGEPPVCAPAE